MNKVHFWTIEKNSYRKHMTQGGYNYNTPIRN